jgi:hypothetical protein
MFLAPHCAEGRAAVYEKVSSPVVLYPALKRADHIFMFFMMKRDPYIVAYMYTPSKTEPSIKITRGCIILKFLNSAFWEGYHCATHTCNFRFRQ